MRDKGFSMLMPEIRVNEKYSHLYYSDFEDKDREKESSPVIKRKTVFTTDYLKRLQGDDINEGIIPPNCRYMEKLNRGSLVVIEEPPAMRTISLHMNLSNEVKELIADGKLKSYGYTDSIKEQLGHKLSLAFPYVIFILYISEYYEVQIGQVFVRPAQMSGLSDYLCKIPLTNISDNQSVCFGDAGMKKLRSMIEAINNIIMVFWSAEFNTDYTYNYLAYKNVPILNKYLEWQYMSKENPMFIYNADWIKHPKTIGQQINKLKEDLNVRGSSYKGYQDLSQMFFNAQDSGKEIKVTPRGRKKHKLFYDICQGIHLYGNVLANVGDTIKMKNGDFAYIDSFVGFVNGGEIKYILMDYKGNNFHIKYTDAAIKFLSKNIDDQRKVQSVTLTNGVVVKPEDILIIKEGSSEVYRKVEYIRKSRGEDGILEMKMGNYYYLSHKVDAKVFDLKHPEICGIPVDKKTEYLVIREPNSHHLLGQAGRYKFNTIEVGSNSSLFANFKRIDRGVDNNYNLGLKTVYTVPPIIPIDQAKPMKSIFRIGRKVLWASYDGSIAKHPAVWSHNGRLIFNNRYTINRPPGYELKHLLSTNQFKIPGPDFDTEFNVGEKVVVADWKNPLDVLNIKTIAGFKYDETNFTISFILMDKDEKLSEVVYVNGNIGDIYTGKIRKVTNKYEKLTVGTKIIAKETGVAAFPKKDVNIIVSIIMDGPHEPLVMCSNGCTLWYSTVMEKFERITMKSKRWQTLQHVPLDLSKIKFQAGDIINGQHDYVNTIGYMLYIPPTSNTVRALPLNYYSGASDSFVFDKYFTSDAIFDNIPNPRIGPTKQIELGKITGFYDFHGGASGEYPASQYSFINERGDINV